MEIKSTYYPHRSALPDVYKAARGKADELAEILGAEGADDVLVVVYEDGKVIFSLKGTPVKGGAMEVDMETGEV